MPSNHTLIRNQRKRTYRNRTWKLLSRVRMLDMEVLNCILDEWYMFVWSKQYLDGLPTHKTAGCEGRDRGRNEVGFGVWKEQVPAPESSEDPAQGWGRQCKEGCDVLAGEAEGRRGGGRGGQTVIVSTNSLIEG